MAFVKACAMVFGQVYAAPGSELIQKALDRKPLSYDEHFDYCLGCDVSLDLLLAVKVLLSKTLETIIGDGFPIALFESTLLAESEVSVFYALAKESTDKTVFVSSVENDTLFLVLAQLSHLNPKPDTVRNGLMFYYNTEFI